MDPDQPKRYGRAGTGQRKLRILLSAYACEPNRGSEPAVGWEWASGLAQHHDVWVLTRANNRDVIEREVGTEQRGRVPEFIYVDLPPWIVQLKRAGLLSVPFYYVLWQWAATRHAKRAGLDVDLVHHVTFNEFRFPGMWWNVHWKVVLGPLGGASKPIREYRRCFGRRWWREWMRLQLLKCWRLNPWTCLSFRRADALIFVTDEMARQFGKKAERTSVLLDAGVPDALLKRNDEAADRKGFLWVGTIEGRKGWRLALEAFAQAFGSERNGPLLTVIGEGPDQAAAQQLARELGIADRVAFCGRRQRSEVWDEMRRTKGLLFSSVRDTSGNVVLEAMGLQCPVLCLDHQGAAVMTSEECALRVEPGPWEETVHAFAAALQRLENEPLLVHRLGLAGRTRVLRYFTWDRKLEVINEIYASVMMKSGHRAPLANEQTQKDS